ncbi:glycosyltransferase family 9 protein [Kosakonia sp. BYX6]|uniref:Glycosyltransferase family 9 protein n=1 Tax=Kosakonia calanthes TaxID=3139408 RepID=A0ABZ3BAC4_9ENTR
MRLGKFHKKKRYLINLIKINILSFLFKNKLGSSIDGASIKSCLLIHDNNKIGDLIILSALYRILAAKNIELSILSCSTGHDFLKSHPHIAHFFIKTSNSVSDTLKLRNELKKYHFDVVLDPFETFPCFSHSLLLSGLNTSYVLGFDKWYKRYYSRYHSHDEHLSEHMSTRTKVIVQQLFGHDENYNYSYDLFIPADIEKSVKEFIGASQVVVINPLGAKKICRLTAEQIKLVHSWISEHYPELRIIYTGHPNDLPSIPVDNIETLPQKDFIYTVALTRFCKYVVSVDTALVHIASAWDRPMLALYPRARTAEYPSPLIWSPNNANALQIISPTCFVSDIENHILLESLEKLFGREVKL